MYKAIYDGPDPAPVIDSLFRTQSQNSTQQLEIDRLTRELGQYDEEFQQLKNQDITIRRLEDQIADFRNSIEDQVRGTLASLNVMATLHSLDSAISYFCLLSLVNFNRGRSMFPADWTDDLSNLHFVFVLTALAQVNEEVAKQVAEVEANCAQTVAEV